MLPEMLQQLTVEFSKLHFAANLLELGKEYGTLSELVKFKFLAVLLEKHSLHCLRIGGSEELGEVKVPVREFE